MSDIRPPEQPTNDSHLHAPVPLPPRYRFEGVLGEGGLGTVVKAYDTQLRVLVAIKTIRHDLAASEPEQFALLRERFQREAIAGAKVRDSPYIVTVYDQVVDAVGDFFLVLQFAPGGTLRDRLVGGPLPMSAALRLTADAARGLLALHEADMVHRDIKPENIFVAADGRAQIGDLGIVQMSTTTFRTRMEYGGDRGHPGTPMYMSPEQAHTTDMLMPEADQYSLGAVLFELVTGKRFKGVYPAERERLLATLPTGTAALIRQMTAEKPEDRCPGMNSVLAMISAIDQAMMPPPDRDATEPTAMVAEQATPPNVNGETLRETPRLALRPTPQLITSPSVPTVTATPRVSRRAVLVGLGGVVIAGGAGAALLATRSGTNTGAVTPTRGIASSSTASAVPVLAVGTSSPTPFPVTATAPPTPISPTSVPSATNIPGGDPNAKYVGPAIEKGGTLKVLMWSHYVPAYDDYFDKWAADWGTKNGLRVTIDHVPTNTVVTASQAEIAVKGGHDLTQLQEAPTPHLFAENLVDVSAVANYLDKKYGGYIEAAKQVGQVNGVWKAVPDFVIPYPGIYRKDYFDAAGITKPVDTWDDILQAGTKLKVAGHPVGLAINQGSGDSNSHMMSILLAFGGKWVEADGKTIAINSPETKDAINYVVELYNKAMTPEVLGWDDSGNNLLLTSGVGSFILNPISAYLSAKKEIQDAVQFSLPPAGPKGRFMIAQGPYSWGVWNWSKQQGAAQQFIADHMDDWLNGTKANLGYELPTLNKWLIKPMPVLSDVPKFGILQDTITDKSTVALGYPGPANAQAAQVAATYVIPQMMAKAVNGAKPEEAIKFAEDQLKTIYK